MKERLKKLARAILGPYAIYRIYALKNAGTKNPGTENPGTEVRAISAEELAAARVPQMADQAGFCGEGAIPYGYLEGGDIAAVCIYWHGERYKQRNFWPLQAGEAKMVQIVTAPGMRGKGLATALIRQSAQDMQAKGFAPLYARIWHSNTPSWRAFEKAGWQRIVTVIEINPLRRRNAWRIKLPR